MTIYLDPTHEGGSKEVHPTENNPAGLKKMARLFNGQDSLTLHSRYIHVINSCRLIHTAFKLKLAEFTIDLKSVNVRHNRSTIYAIDHEEESIL